MRVRIALVLVACLASVLPDALPAQSQECAGELRFGKPRPFAWEFSPFLGANLFDEADDNGFDLDDDFAFGARLGFNWTRHWETELSYEVAPDLRTEGRELRDIDAQYIDLNMLFNMNTGDKDYPNFGRWQTTDRWTPYFTFGVGHAAFDFDDRDTDEEFTVNAGLGTRIMLSRIAGLRLDARARAIPDADMVVYAPSAGLSLIMGGRALRDSDADMVLDPEDRCPNTPQGCEVDCFGCAYDEDGDGVCNGVDRCPGTTAGCFVDAFGCALDEDGDGVCDGIDTCPETPVGCWVDEKGCPRDSDGDGVCDGVDRCPNTQEGCRVDSAGCPLDSDGDGVCDGRDECPRTPRGQKVDERGCPVLKLVLSDVWFEFNKAVVRDFYYPFLDEVARSLKADNNLNVSIELEGHTDAVGTNRYNFELGLRRSRAVKEYLVSKGIHPNRLVTSTVGETEPIATNSNADGRRRNRRVEMHPRGPLLSPTDIRHYKIVLRNVYFDTDKATLRDEYKPFLREVAQAMDDEGLSEAPIILLGMADVRAGNDYNRELSERRARTVKDFLVANGISSRRIEIRPLGESRASGRSPSTMQDDRRVEVHSR